jgi:hypothetical protein
MHTGVRVALSSLFAILIFSASPAHAQQSSWGDLSVSTGRLDFDLNGTGNAYSVAVRTKRHLTSHLALELGGSYARYCGDQFLGECEPIQLRGTTTLFMPEAQLQYRWNLGRVSPYVGGGMGVARLSLLDTPRWRPTFSTAGGAAVYLTDRLGINGELRVRGHGRNFSGTTSEITAGLVWRFAKF